MNVPKRIDTVAFLVAISIVAAVSAVAYRTTDALVETTRWVDHTHEVLASLSDILVGTMSAGPARRAYSVSANPADLASMHASIARSRESVAHVRDLIGDNREQRERLDLLEPLLEQRAVELEAEAIPGKAPVGNVEALRRARVSARIGGIIDEMKQAEKGLLELREAAARRDATLAKVADVGGTAASIVILAIAFARLRRENKRRLQSEEIAKESEKKATATTRFLDSIVENIPNMLFVKEAVELRFERINRAGELLLGVSRAELIGKNDHDFFPAEEADFFRKKDREALKGGVVVDIAEEQIETTNGQRWLHTKKVPVVTHDGQPAFLLGISEDVTELRAARREAQEAARELEAFSYSVAHDLRAPLRSIDGFSQVLLEDAGPSLNEKSREHLQRVRAATQRMGQIIDDLLTLARVSRGELRREEIDLTPLATACLDELRRSDLQRNIALEIEPALKIYADTNLLRIVLENLIGNAFKFTSKVAAAKLEIGLRLDAGKPVYFIRDNGVGFDMKYSDKLFRPFQRLHDANEFPGTGIGLATVHRIVERHGGRIWAEGEEGHGATFFFTLGDGPNKRMG